jgi:hypothetical protein
MQWSYDALQSHVDSRPIYHTTDYDLQMST